MPNMLGFGPGSKTIPLERIDEGSESRMFDASARQLSQSRCAHDEEESELTDSDLDEELRSKNSEERFELIEKRLKEREKVRKEQEKLMAKKS
jgi:hypothetical protein